MDECTRNLHLINVGPAVSVEMESAFEQAFGFPIPDELKLFWEKHGNGGDVPGNISIDFWDGNQYDSTILQCVLGAGHPTRYLSIEFSLNNQPQPPMGFLAFASDALGNFFLLRVIEPHIGSIYFFDHELYGSGHSELPVRIADSLEHFVSKLQVHEPGLKGQS